MKSPFNSISGGHGSRRLSVQANFEEGSYLLDWNLIAVQERKKPLMFFQIIFIIYG
jgi:hypothetical protein